MFIKQESVDTAVFTQETPPGTAAILHENAGHSQVCPFHTQFSNHNGILA